MNYNYRVKVLGHTIEQLLALGFGINAHECGVGEHWLVGPSQDWLETRVKRHKLDAISQYEVIR